MLQIGSVHLILWSFIISIFGNCQARRTHKLEHKTSSSLTVVASTQVSADGKPAKKIKRAKDCQGEPISYPKTAILRAHSAQPAPLRCSLQASQCSTSITLCLLKARSNLASHDNHTLAFQPAQSHADKYLQQVESKAALSLLLCAMLCSHMTTVVGMVHPSWASSQSANSAFRGSIPPGCVWGTPLNPPPGWQGMFPNGSGPLLGSAAAAAPNPFSRCHSAPVSPHLNTSDDLLRLLLSFYSVNKAFSSD